MALSAQLPQRTEVISRLADVDFWKLIDALHRRGSGPVDASSVAFFRIAFGVVALVAIIRFLAYDWIDELNVDPLHHFSYVGFEWVRAWPSPWMHLHFGALGLLALAIIVAWLLWGRSRPLAFAVLIVFHLITGQLFMIGVFPYMMIAASPFSSQSSC